MAKPCAASRLCFSHNARYRATRGFAVGDRSYRGVALGVVPDRETPQRGVPPSVIAAAL